MASHLPEFIDGYRILHLLGHGGMGEVYLAEETDTGRRAALKTLLSRSPGGTYRFQREFRSIARLNHPHVIRVFSYGMIDRTPYFTMEFIEGSTLKDSMRDWESSYRKNDVRATRRLVQTCKIMTQICSALYYIHTRSLIHRDLKPANIMVTTDGDAKIMDFGLAREIDASVALTKTGAVIGTVAYMSPEQCRGARLDPRSDLYSLGVLLYEIVTGQKPFSGDRPMDILFKHVDEQPAPPSFLNPNVTPEIESIIMRLLEKDPHRRFPNAQDLKRRWEEYLSFLTGETLVSDMLDSIDSDAKRIEPHWDPGFSGRDEEMAQIRAALDPNTRAFRPVILVEGEAGIGKSRLIGEVVQKARLEGCKVFFARCFPGENLPFRAFSDVMDAISASLWRSSPEIQAKSLGDDRPVLARSFPGFANLGPMPGEIEPESLSPAEERLRLFNAVRSILLRIGEGHPVLLALDNLQWADPDAIDLLRFIVNASTASTTGDPCRLSVVCVYRVPDSETNVPLSELTSELAHASSVQRLLLRPLNQDAMSAMLRSMLGIDESMPKLAAWLHEMTGGNPFFLEEIIINLLETKALFRKKGKWYLDIGNQQSVPADSTGIASGSVVVPKGIHDMILQRIETIRDKTKKVLEWAAVAGRRFQYELLREVAADNTEELFDCLDELLHAGVLSERRGRDDEFFEFDQALVQEVVYGRLSASRRRVYHRRLAEYFEGCAGEHPDIDALAFHWSASDRSVKAPPYLFRSAESAIRRYANGHAIQSYSRAIEIIEGSKDDSPGVIDHTLLLDCLNRRGDALNETGRTSLAEKDYESALARAVTISDRYNEGRAYNKLGVIAETRGQYPRAIELTEKSMRIWKELGHDAPLTTCLINLGVQNWKLGWYPDALDVYRQALDHARRLRNRQLEVWSRSNIGLVLISLGNERQAAEYFRECLAIFERAQMKPHVVQTMVNLAWALFLAGEFEESERCNREALELAQTIDHAAACAILPSNLGELDRARGFPAAAQQKHEESLRLAIDLEDQSLIADNHVRLGLDAVLQGRYATGLGLIAKALESFSLPEALDYEIPSRITLAYWSGELGFTDRVDEHLDRIDQRLRIVQNPRFSVMYGLLRHRSLLAARKSWSDIRGAAERCLADIVDSASQIETADVRMEFERACARQDFLDGRCDAAIRRIESQVSDVCGSENRILFFPMALDLLEYLSLSDPGRFEEWRDRLGPQILSYPIEPPLTRWRLLGIESLERDHRTREALVEAEALLRTLRGQAQGFSESEIVLFWNSGLRKKLIFDMMRLYVELGEDDSMRALAHDMQIGHGRRS